MITLYEEECRICGAVHEEVELYLERVGEGMWYCQLCDTENWMPTDYFYDE